MLFTWNTAAERAGKSRMEKRREAKKEREEDREAEE
jgi:hypothetical protein